MDKITDGSQPLTDGQHETFAKLLAKGKTSQTSAYHKAGYPGDRTQACKLAAKHNIKQRVAWLKTQSASDQTLTQIEKREKLAGIVRQAARYGDIIKAIEVDNVMAGDNKPTELKVAVEVTVAEWTRRIRQRK